MSDSLKTHSNKLILLALLAGSLSATLNGSVLNIALPLFMNIFDTSVTTTQWLMAGYILATGLISPSVAYLSDRFGARKMYIFALLAVFITSLLCPLSPNIYSLIFFRFLQGIAGGIILPISLALIYQLVDREQQALSVSLWNMANMGGGVLGPVLAGGLLNFTDWHWLFLIGLPFIIIALVLSFKYIPQKSSEKLQQKLDVVSMVTISMASVLLLMAFSNGESWGWGNPLTLSFIAIGLIASIYFVYRCLHQKQPLLNFKVFKYKLFVFYLILDFIVSNISYSFIFVAPLFFQNALGLSVFQTSLVTLPSAAMMMLTMPLIGKLYNPYGPKRLILLGACIVVVASLPLITLKLATPIWLIIMCFVCRSLGMSLISTPSINMGMSAMPPELAAHASAIANWLKQMAGSLIISFSSVLMMIRMNTYRSEIVASEQQIYFWGTRDIFIYMFVIMLFAIPIGLSLPKKAPKQPKI